MMKFENVEIGCDIYKPVFKDGDRLLLYNQRNTWDDGRYLLVDSKSGHVYRESAFNADDDAGWTSDYADILNAVEEYGDRDELLEAYLKAYGDLKQDVVTLVKRLRGAA